jgi:hypothetical protein|tara:strand:+ start:583 stop:729 length:147 start_codon:yes stop_codon:yes gene_type:complete
MVIESNWMLKCFLKSNKTIKNNPRNGIKKIIYHFKMGYSKLRFKKKLK